LDRYVTDLTKSQSIGGMAHNGQRYAMSDVGVC